MATSASQSAIADRVARLKAARLQARKNPSLDNSIASTNKERIASYTSTLKDPQMQATALKSAIQLARIQQQRTDSSLINQDPLSPPEDDQQEEIARDFTDPVTQLKQDFAAARKRRQQEENLSLQAAGSNGINRGAKQRAAMIRGWLGSSNLAGVAADFSTMGMTFIWNILYYTASLAWLNVEMFYGIYFAKRKSKFIAPLSWDPLPMPIDKDAYILQTFVIAANIALVMVGTTVLLTTGCLIYDISQLLSAPLATISTGGTNLCTGTLLFSLIGS